MQLVSPAFAFKKKKGLSSSPWIRLWHFLTRQHVIWAICSVSCRDWGGRAYLTHQGWHWLTGVVKAAAVAFDAPLHIFTTCFRMKLGRVNFKTNHFLIITFRFSAILWTGAVIFCLPSSFTVFLLLILTVLELFCLFQPLTSLTVRLPDLLQHELIVR